MGRITTTMKDRDARYYQLLERAFGPRAFCKLSGAPTDKKNGKCSACTFKIEFEFDEVIATLVRRGKLYRGGPCPFFLFCRRVGEYTGLWAGSATEFSGE